MAESSPGLPSRTQPIIFRPDAQRPALMAAVAAGVALALALALAGRGAADGITFAAFAAYVLAATLLAAAVLAGYWALALTNLRYEIGDGALTIVWGLTRQVVPLGQMERVVRGRNQGTPRVQGLALPGWRCHVGRAVLPRLGTVLFYSTHRAPAEILYIVTGHETYGLSPPNPQLFIQALQISGEEDPGVELRQEVVRRSVVALPVWSDRIALGLAAAGVLLALAAIGVIFARYTGIPERTVIPFPETDHIESKRALLGIPVTAAVLFLLNTLTALLLHRIVRPIAYIFLLGGAFVQALLLAAALLAT